ncbi:SRPBCC family protein [Actinacidiphila acidipaludis]|uniref:SRPBCC family protein n=1 Tax=Actinacidiphila acidipaludis TaxID=2873382 RepID=A0ABS7QGE1_9ACTN|nr:SRPBCC family protein [Streptomyces acidipaludis]MBY8882222.1 SRPBCC family protein [Streptomyces acidipaludis]
MTERERPAGDTTSALPVDRLMEQGQELLTALGERAIGQISDKLSGATEKLTDFAESGGGGGGLAAALKGGQSLASGKSGFRSMLDAGMEQTKQKVKGAFGGGKDDGGGGGGGDKGQKIKVTNIVESIEVGVPVRVAYNQWTEFEDFPTFMKKVENIKQESETEMNWKAQVFWSHRAWKATVIEQMPDERIHWESEGEKGRVDGTVTFHELTPDLTKILLVLEYHPQGFFERTGNLWRAQGRRARLELKHFQRHVMTRTILNQDEVHGWRGEVSDGEVVRSDEEVREEEEQDERDESEEGAEGEEGAEDQDAEGEFDEEEPEDLEGEEGEEDEDDELADEDEEDGFEDDEDADDEDELADEEDGDEDEDEEDEDEDGDDRAGSGTRTRTRSRRG